MIEDPRPSRIPPIVLALLGAAALLFAALSSRWLANAGDNGSIEMGLRSTTECGSVGMLLGPRPDECRTEHNSAYAAEWNTDSGQYSSAAFAPCGLVTSIACWVAALALLAAAALALARRCPQLPVSPSSIALLAIMVGLVSGCVFVATKPGPGGFVGVGIAFWIFGTGAVLGLAGSILLARVNRPADPDLTDGAIDPDKF
ncbi:MAG: hypothetical protein ABI467_32870 [Kofleriaceae bacterium]